MYERSKTAVSREGGSLQICHHPVFSDASHLSAEQGRSPSFPYEFLSYAHSSLACINCQPNRVSPSCDRARVFSPAALVGRRSLVRSPQGFAAVTLFYQRAACRLLNKNMAYLAPSVSSTCVGYISHPSPYIIPVRSNCSI